MHADSASHTTTTTHPQPVSRPTHHRRIGAEPRVLVQRLPDVAGQQRHQLRLDGFVCVDGGLGGQSTRGERGGREAPPTFIDQSTLSRPTHLVVHAVHVAPRAHVRTGREETLNVEVGLSEARHEALRLADGVGHLCVVL